MPKFVPRQRKHKVLARLKAQSNGSEEAVVIDSNAVEHLPPDKAEIEEKKRKLREELRQGTKVSSKKAKRLEKYIENKLKKDENRQLLEKLANSKVDTSLFQSSRKIGQGAETKREQVHRVWKNKQAGIDLDENTEDILYMRTTVGQDTAEPEDDSESPPSSDVSSHRVDVVASASIVPNPTQPAGSVFGTGLKRPLDVDEEGKPVIKKRQRRGGFKSKSLPVQELENDPSDDDVSWDGFSSVSNEEDSEDHASDQLDDELHETSDVDPLLEKDSSGSEESDVSSDSEGENSESESKEDPTERQQRSSAFKAWANQQRNEASGFVSSSDVQETLVIPKVEGFTPRAPEDEPLPPELQLTNSVPRKAYSVTLTRPPEIQEGRLKLPVVAEEQKIMEAIHNNTTVVICGSTGSGKTTQVPQFLYEAGYGSPDSPTPGLIGVTQPRRVAAVSMSKRVAEELGDHGNKVAYQIRFEGTVAEDTAIKFMTDGVLLREVAQDIALRKYSAIVIDEAHERNVNTDILIGMLSRVVKLREEMALEDHSIKPLKLVIMSATLRVSDFAENKTLFPRPPPVIEAEGRQYPVTMHFARRTHHDYVEEAFQKISRGHRKLPPGGFLVFMTSQNEIIQLMKRLKDAFRSGTTGSGSHIRVSGQDAPIEAEDVDFGDTMNDEIDDSDDDDDDSVDINIDDDKEFEIPDEEAETGPTKIHVLPLYSLLPTREQLRVFQPPPDGSRLVILATNVAETSLTIPGIRYVFDCGRSKERKFDPVTSVQSFEIGWISKASASQRAGRAGRMGPGHCYRLYSSAVYERDFPEFAQPEILRMPIEGVVLQLKAMNLQHVVNFPFPTPPDRHMLAQSEKLLTYLSAISTSGQVSKIGATMSIFPLSPRFSRILLIGHLHDCLPYTIALVAGLSAAEIFVPENQVIPAAGPREDEAILSNSDMIDEDARARLRRRFNKVQYEFCSLDDKSDAIKMLQVVGEYAHDPTEAWCQNHFVRSKVLKEILQLRRQITELLRTNIPAFAHIQFQEKLPPPSPKQVKALKQMVAAGFIDHVAIRADLAPIPPAVRRKPTRSIDVPYLTLFPSHLRSDEEDKAVYIHPSSPLAHISTQECPEYIVYSYLQRPSTSGVTSEKTPKTRMHSLTDISGSQLTALAKGTPLLHYGKPIKEVMPKTKSDGGPADVRECWVIPYLRAEGTGDMGWPLPAKKVVQRKVPGKGWIVE